MNGCATHGGLVGGYVLGALEPDEMEEMRRHVAGCLECEREASALGELPRLLDRIEPADVPPPALAPQIEEAVLDRFARERRREREAGSSTGGGIALRLRGARAARLRGAPAALAAACAAALVLGLALAWPFGGGGGDGGGGGAYASARLAAVGPASDARASAWAAEVPAGTAVRLEARGLSPGRGVYELWCVRADGRWISGGTFRAGSDGRAEADLTAAVRPGDYHLMVVTRRPDAAAEGERGTAVLRGRLTY